MWFDSAQPKREKKRKKGKREKVGRPDLKIGLSRLNPNFCKKKTSWAGSTRILKKNKASWAGSTQMFSWKLEKIKIFIEKIIKKTIKKLPKSLPAGFIVQQTSQIPDCGVFF